jgi:hypothetical protein
MKNSAMTIGSAALKLVQAKATITPPKEVAGTVDAFVAKQEAKTDRTQAQSGRVHWREKFAVRHCGRER